MTLIEQLKQAYQLGTNSHLDDLPSPAQLQTAIMQAEKTIARYVSVDTPLSTAAHEGLVVAIALYLLVGQSYEERHPIYVAYHDAMQWLSRLAEGKFDDSVGEGGGETGGGALGEVHTQSRPRLFSRQTLKRL